MKVINYNEPRLDKDELGMQLQARMGFRGALHLAVGSKG